MQWCWWCKRWAATSIIWGICKECGDDWRPSVKEKIR